MGEDTELETEALRALGKQHAALGEQLYKKNGILLSETVRLIALQPRDAV